jgi:hypothetical protein
MLIWWAFWIISNIFSNICSRVYDPENMSTVQFSGYLFIITEILTIITALLAIKMIRDITQRQDARYKNLASIYENKPPPNFDALNYAGLMKVSHSGRIKSCFSKIEALFYLREERKTFH